MGVLNEIGNQPHGRDRLLLTERQAMHSDIEANKSSLSGARGIGMAGMSLPRGGRRGADGGGQWAV